MKTIIFGVYTHFLTTTHAQAQSSTVSRGPITLWHQSLEDLVPNFGAGDPTNAGFYQVVRPNLC